MSDKPLALSTPQEVPEFDGDTYDPAVDHDRLGAQLLRVIDAFAGGAWLSLREAEDITGDPQASISAQLRHLRKKRFGEHVVEKRRRTEGHGTYEYRLIVNPEAPLK